MRVSGVFRDRINRRAIIDRLELSIDSDDFNVASPHIKVLRTRGIRSPHSWYARSVETMTEDGNPVEVRYGRLRRYVPPARVIFHSEKCPLTFSEISSFISKLTATEHATVQYIEIACDVQPLEVRSITPHIFTRCRRFRKFCDQDGRRTVYFGSPRSGRQLRVYQKRSDITRIEIVLRKQALAKLGSRHIGNLRHLRRVPQLDFFQIRAVNRQKLRAALAPYMYDWRAEMLNEWPPSTRHLQPLMRILRTWRLELVDLDRVFEDHRVQRVVAEMLGNLEW